MFKFKEISSTDMQVIIEEEEHFIARAAKRYETIEIEGRDGAIFNELGYSYVERPIYVQCLNIDKIDDILAWLDGEGEFEYKGKKTTARFYSELDPQREGYIRIIDTTFIRDPFWIKANEEFVTVKESKVTETEESKSIHVEDASTIGQLEVLGNHEQETSLYSGNLERGSISESGTVDASNRIRTAEYIEVRGNTEINVSADGANEYLLAFYNSNKEYIQSSPWANLGTSTAIIANSQFVKVLLRKTDDSSITVSDVSNFIVGPTPSSNYPSKVKCLGSNKQLFNKDQSTIEKGSINMDGTFTNSNTRIRVYDISLKGNKTYTVSSKDNNLNIVPYFYDEVGTFISYLNGWKTLPFTFKMPNNAKILKLLFRNKSDTEITAEDILNADIKIEEGTEATPYSPPGQGSTLINKINKNRFNKNTAIQGYRLDALGEYYVQSNYFTSDYISAKPLTYYALNYSVTGAMQRICFYDKNKNFISANINSNIFQTPENCKYIRICNELTYLNETQIEEGKTSTNYIEHQQEDYLLYIQQEMLKEDYFVKEADGWKEVHNYAQRYKFTGNENISYSSVNQVFYTDMFTNKQAGTNNFIINAFRVISTDSYANMPNYSSTGNSTSSRVVFKYTELTSIEEFKQFLQERYGEGNPVYIDYETATPTKLACTSEQSAVLEELSNMDLFEGVNNIITAEDIALLKLKYMKITDEKISNEGNVESRPIFRLEKTSTESVELTINNCRFKYNFNDEEYVEIDCEEKEVKYEGLNRNRQIEIGYEFPILNTGDNDIKMYSGDCVIKVLRKDRWL